MHSKDSDLQKKQEKKIMNPTIQLILKDMRQQWQSNFVQNVAYIDIFIQEKYGTIFKDREMVYIVQS